MRRLVVISSVLLSLGVVAEGQETAYKALRVVGAKRGEKSLERILAISGRSGHPQPVDWTVAVEDPAARGGVREFDVVASQVNAERAPLKPPAGKPIDLSSLNTDSDGAFNVAEAEARRRHVGFDAIDYALASDPLSGKPVWTLKLLDDQQRLVGSVKIEAENGNLIAGQDWVPNGAASVSGVSPRMRDADEAYIGGPGAGGPRSQTDAGPNAVPPRIHGRGEASRIYSGDRTRYNQENGYVQVPSPRVSDQASDDDQDADSHPNEGLVNKAHRYGESVVHFGRTVVNKTGRAARRIGGWFQKKFTGEDTISPDATDKLEDQGPALTDPYSRPVQPVPAE